MGRASSAFDGQYRRRTDACLLIDDVAVLGPDVVGDSGGRDVHRPRRHRDDGRLVEDVPESGCVCGGIRAPAPNFTRKRYGSALLSSPSTQATSTFSVFGGRTQRSSSGTIATGLAAIVASIDSAARIDVIGGGLAAKRPVGQAAPDGGIID
jgi:hypothetical protein